MGATPIVAVVAVARTAVRPVDGELAGWNPVALAGVVGRETLERAGLDAGALDEVVVGCADPVGACGADAARAIALAAGWPVEVGGMVIDRGETSGLAAVQAAVAAIRDGQARTVLVIGLGLCSVVPPGAAALNRAYGAPWAGVAERFAERGGLLPAPRLSERAAHDAGIGRTELDAAAEESRRRRAEAGVSTAIVAVAARPGSSAARGVYRGDPVTADVGRDWGDTTELPPAFDHDGLLTAATFAPPADSVAAVLLQAVAVQPGATDSQPAGTAAAPASTGAAGGPQTAETQPPPSGNPVGTVAGTGRAEAIADTQGPPSLTTAAGTGRAEAIADTQGPPSLTTAAGTGRAEAVADTQGPPSLTTAAGTGRAEAVADTQGPPSLTTAAGTGRAAGDPFDPVGNVGVAVSRALAGAGVGLDAVDDIAVVEHDAATVSLVARALDLDGARINRGGGAVATGNAGPAEELRLITDGLTGPPTAGGRLLLTISAGPTGSAAIVWQSP